MGNAFRYPSDDLGPSKDVLRERLAADLKKDQPLWEAKGRRVRVYAPQEVPNGPRWGKTQYPNRQFREARAPVGFPHRDRLMG